MNDNVVSHRKENHTAPFIDLETMDDEVIKKLISDGYKLLDRRKREHEKQVKEQIRKMAVEAGINVTFSTKLARKSK